MPFIKSLLKVLVPLITGVLVLTFWNRASLSSVPGIATSAPSGKHKPVTPYYGSWRTWLNPCQSAQPDTSQTSGKEWNILYHLGGNGPWVENIHEGAASSLETPEGCSIDQVHMVCLYPSCIPEFPSQPLGRVPGLLIVTDITTWGTISHASCWEP
jgi:acid phosphatase